LNLDQYRPLREKGRKLDLHYPTAILSDTNTCDEHDIVYVIFPSLPAKEKELITLDDKKPFPHVFAEATHASIAHTGRIGIMSLVAGSVSERIESKVASWAVDFTFPEGKRPIRAFQLKEGA
jgi:hypothetical protein